MKPNILDVPFVLNSGDGMRCGAAALASAIQYQFGVVHSLDGIDQLSERAHGMSVWSPQLMNAAIKLGYSGVLYTASDPLPILKGQEHIDTVVNDDIDSLTSTSDFEIVVKALRECLEADAVVVRKTTIKDICNHINRGEIPIALIDYQHVVDRFQKFQGHYVAVIGYDAEYIYIHDSGPTVPTENKKVDKAIFLKAFQASGTDSDMIVLSRLTRE